jgi:hypothetical protein
VDSTALPGVKKQINDDPLFLIHNFINSSAESVQMK